MAPGGKTGAAGDPAHRLIDPVFDKCIPEQRRNQRSERPHRNILPNAIWPSSIGSRRKPAISTWPERAGQLPRAKFSRGAGGRLHLDNGAADVGVTQNLDRKHRARPGDDVVASEIGLNDPTLLAHCSGCWQEVPKYTRIFMHRAGNIQGCRSCVRDVLNLPSHQF